MNFWRTFGTFPSPVEACVTARPGPCESGEIRKKKEKKKKREKKEKRRKSRATYREKGGTAAGREHEKGRKGMEWPRYFVGPGVGGVFSFLKKGRRIGRIEMTPMPMNRSQEIQKPQRKARFIRS
jgi:hypothetical protein